MCKDNITMFGLDAPIKGPKEGNGSDPRAECKKS